MTPVDAAGTAPAHAPGATGAHAWQRLSARMIWVDLAQSVVSSLPALIAVTVVGVDPQGGEMWPLIALAVLGVVGALADAWRWVFTRYRITATHVELRTGLLVRRRRSIQRDRIRSVDVEAKLRHRLSGLRVVKVGAGQQAASGESALGLDAVSAADARALRADLLDPADPPADAAPTDEGGEAEAAEPRAPAEEAPLEVFARFRPGWVRFNLFSIWAYIVALGVGWGGFWLVSGFGVDVAGVVAGLADWEAIGTAGTAAIAFLAVTVVGAAGLGMSYFTEYWKFELARVRGPEGTQLRTRQGLFTTREVNRDEKRIRGVQVSEPVLWRWMGMSDTNIVTTGLSLWSMSQPTAILPRGPVAVARRVADAVLGGGLAPMHAPLERHPRAALRRRLWWASASTAVLAGVLGWLAATGVLPAASLWAAAAFGPIALGAAFVAYRALGHAIVGPYLVARSGLVSRATTVLRRSAVSTVVVRESLLQRRLGLRTVSAATAAGEGGYDIPDVSTRESLDLVQQIAPDLVEPFLRRAGSGAPAGAPAAGRAVSTAR